MTESKVQIPVRVWLKTIDLSQYENLFAKYKTVGPMFKLDDGDVLRAGVKDSEHRSRIVNSLSLLASKLKQTGENNSFMNNNDQLISQSHVKRDRLELESQLRLPSSDIRSSAWFHGTISRQEAEALIGNDGDFLVRESQSQRGSYVLTCKHDGRPLHFVVNKFEEKNGKYRSVEYGFEGSRFASIQSLIMAHISESLEITAISHALISKPVNRTVPLSNQSPPKHTQSNGVKDPINTDSADSEYSSKLSPPTALLFEYSNLFIDGRNSVVTSSRNSVQSQKSVSNHQHRSLQHGDSKSSKSSSESLSKSSNSSPKVLHKTLKSSNPSLDHVSSDPQLKNLIKKPTLPRQNTTNGTSLNSRTWSDGELNSSPTHLPTRSGELREIKSNVAHPAVQIRNHALYDEGGDYSDYIEVKRMTGSRSAGSIASRPNQTYTKNFNPASKLDDRTPRASTEAVNDETTPTCRSAPVDIGGEDYDTPDSNVREIHEFSYPSIPVQYLDIENFTSHLLTPANKPLDPECMYKTKQVLLQDSHKVISQHITYLDLHLLKVAETRNLGAGVFSGIEAITLPFGQHFRVAALERSRCLTYLSAVTILACTEDLVERSRMLKQWVLVALELLRAHGNIFSFMAIVEGLSSKPIERLKMTWKIFNRMEPGLHSSWKTKIREAYNSLQDTGSYQTNENVSIPYVTPICEWYDRSMNDMTAWLADGTDINTMLSHLEMGRIISGSTSSYSKKVQSIVRFFTPRPDMKDLFKVELHMKLLYGHKGALADQQERWAKFSQILDILSQRAERNDGGTEC